MKYCLNKYSQHHNYFCCIHVNETGKDSMSVAQTDIETTLKSVVSDLVLGTNTICDLKPPLDKISRTNVQDSVIPDPTKNELVEYRKNFNTLIFKLAATIDDLFSLLIIPALMSPHTDTTWQPARAVLRHYQKKLHGIIKHCLFLLQEYYVNSSHVSLFFTNIINVVDMGASNDSISGSFIPAGGAKTAKAASLGNIQPQNEKTTFRNHLLHEMLKLRVLCYFLDATKYTTTHRDNIPKGLRTKAIFDFPNIKEYEVCKPRFTTKKEFYDETNSIWIKLGRLLFDNSSTPDSSAKGNGTSSLRTPQSTVLVEKPISLYTQSDLEDAFRLLMYRWKTVEYHRELGAYVELLMDRAAFLIVFSGSAEGHGQQHHNHAPINHYIDCKDFITKTPNGVAVTFDYLYRLEIRFESILFKLNRLNLRRSIINTQESALGDTDSGQYEFLATFFKQYVFKWANGPMAALNSDGNRNRYMILLVPPGDEVWLSYLYPLDSVSTVDTIFKKLHPDVSETLINESTTPVATTILRNSVSVAKVRDEIVMQAIESIFSFVGDNSRNLKPIINGNFSFKHKFLFDELSEDSLLSKEFKLSKKPFLAVLFSRYMVHRAALPPGLNAIHPVVPAVDVLPETIKRRTVLHAYQGDATVYHALARLMIILRTEFPKSKITHHVWACIKKEVTSLNT